MEPRGNAPKRSDLAGMQTSGILRQAGRQQHGRLQRMREHIHAPRQEYLKPGGGVIFRTHSLVVAASGLMEQVGKRPKPQLANPPM